MVYRRKYVRGAAAVMSVALMAVLSAGALVAWHIEDDVSRRRTLQAERGRVMALWLEAANAATMRHDYRTVLAGDPDGCRLVPHDCVGLPPGVSAGVPGAPPGLPVPNGLTLGIIADGLCGGALNCVDTPMAWAVLEVDADARSPARLAALGAGMVDVAVGGGAVSAMQGYADEIEDARGAPIPDGALFATADLGLAHDDEAVYRRQQPGRPWANRMESTLDMDSQDVVEGFLVEGLEATTEVPSAGAPPEEGDVVVSNDPSVCVGEGRPAEECEARVLGDASGADLTAGRLEASEVLAPSMTVSGSVNAETAVVEMALEGGSVCAGRTVPAVPPATGEVCAEDGRVDAASLAATGAVEAGLMIVGEVLSGVGTLASGADLYARQVSVPGGRVDGARVEAGELDVGSLQAGTVKAGSINGGGVVFGPCAKIEGTLKVDPGPCDGCLPPVNAPC